MAIQPLVVVLVPAWVGEGDEDIDAAIADYLNDSFEEVLRDAIDYSVTEHDGRAQLLEVRATEVRLDESTVEIDYEVDYDAYYGCKDLDAADTIERTLVGTRNGRELRFKRPIVLPPRDMDDEF